MGTRLRATERQNVRFLLLSTNLAREWLQIDTDLLLIITSTADELSGGTNIDDLEWPWTPKIGFLVILLAILGCNTHFIEWIAPKPFKIDQDNLRMKCSASRCQQHLVARVYGRAHAMTWESRTIDCHDTDHAASLCPVPQPGTHFQQAFVTCHHHLVSVAIWKLSYLSGPVAWTSTFVIATCY